MGRGAGLGNSNFTNSRNDSVAKANKASKQDSLAQASEESRKQLAAAIREYVKQNGEFECIIISPLEDLDRAQTKQEVFAQLIGAMLIEADEQGIDSYTQTSYAEDDYGTDEPILPAEKEFWNKHVSPCIENHQKLYAESYEYIAKHVQAHKSEAIATGVSEDDFLKIEKIDAAFILKAIQSPEETPILETWYQTQDIYFDLVANKWLEDKPNLLKLKNQIQSQQSGSVYFNLEHDYFHTNLDSEAIKQNFLAKLFKSQTNEFIFKDLEKRANKENPGFQIDLNQSLESSFTGSDSKERYEHVMKAGFVLKENPDLHKLFAETVQDAMAEHAQTLAEKAKQKGNELSKPTQDSLENILNEPITTKFLQDFLGL